MVVAVGVPLVWQPLNAVAAKAMIMRAVFINSFLVSMGTFGINRAVIVVPFCA